MTGVFIGTSPRESFAGKAYLVRETSEFFLIRTSAVQSFLGMKEKEKRFMKASKV